MKRFIPWQKLVGLKFIVGMREHEGGDYVRYEEVRGLVENILDDLSLWETKPEILIKEWGE